LSNYVTKHTQSTYSSFQDTTLHSIKVHSLDRAWILLTSVVATWSSPWLPIKKY